MINRMLLLHCVLVLYVLRETSASCKPPKANLGTEVYSRNSLFRRYVPSYDVGSSVTYRCRISTCRLVGASRRTCGVLYDGSYGWAPRAPRCDCTYSSTRYEPPPTPSAYFCNRPSDPVYGSIHAYPNSKRRFSVGERISYVCNDGYRLNGIAEVTCGHHGWSHTPSCDEIFGCNRPSDPQYGSVNSPSYKRRYAVNDWVTYRCNNGYCMNGDPKVYCRRSGWTHTPTCRHGCDKRAAPDYGTYSGSKTYWCPGDNVRYSCLPSFEMDGNEYSTCGNNYRWNNDVPKCIKICIRLGTPRYALVSSLPVNRRRYREGDYASYRCNTGYCMHGSADVYCRHAGWDRSPACRPGCKKRDPPQYGSYRGNKNSWCPGDRARYGCNPGFRMDGEEYSACGADGSWEYDVPKCRKICNRPSNPRNGRIVSRPSDKTTYMENEYVTYHCNPGYCQRGSADVYCRHRGWDAAPTCNAGCKHRKAPSYGSSYGNNQHWCPGQRARYRCNPTFRMEGNEYSNCQYDGSWSHPVPYCRKICDRPANPQNGYVVSDPERRNSFAENETVSYQCNPGYCRYGNADVVCRHRGFDDPATCRKACPHRNPPRYGSYYGNNRSWCPGRRARYRCNPTFRRVGSEYSTCQNNGKWNSNVPSCSKVCSRPPNPENGEVVASKDNYNEDEYVTYRCNPGYCLYGNSRVHCRHRGWEDAPVCRKTCAHRPAPSYGSYYDDNTIWCPGHRARFQCDDTFQRVGDEYSTCSGEGRWLSSVPICRKICDRPANPQNGYVVSDPERKNSFAENESVSYQCNPGYCRYGNADVVCTHRGFDDPATCRKACPHRNPPRYGSYYGNNRSWCPGRRARYRCNPTFRRVGSEYSTCQNNGKWNSNVPSCSKVCSRPPNPENGEVVASKDNYNEDEYVTYRCNPGYCLYGNSRIHCRHRGWEDAPVCRKTCAHRPAPSYGSYYGDNTIWCPGHRARFQCDDTFQRVGDEYSTCSGEGKWLSSVPICRKICVRPSDPSNGFILSTPRVKSRFSQDESLSYNCFTGYCLNGDSDVTCLHTGWASEPTCRRGCPFREPPSYGSYRGEGRIWCPEQRAEFACDATFQMVGDRYSSCRADGTWASDVPMCKKVCSRPEDPQYGSVVSTPPDKSRYNQDESVRYICNVGYCLDGDPVAYCRHTGWTQPPTCKRACSHRSPPSYGSYEGNNTQWCPGQRARFLCDRTFQRHGKEYSTCRQDSSWDNDVPNCRKVCERPANPQYGYVVSRPSLKNRFSEDDSVRYQCNPGYCLQGDPNARCRHTGWDNTPRCIRGCPHRQPPGYGSQYGNKKVWCPGDKASYRCQQYYEMNGYANSTCKSDSSWNNAVPSCDRVCHRPRSFDNGWIEPVSKRKYGVNEYMTFHCNSGYCLHGNPNSYCRHSGWTSFPRCRHGCRRRDPPEYGSEYGNRTYYCPGDQANYKCQRYYQMYGEANSTCQDNGNDYSWNYDVPNCRRMCDRPTHPPNGRYMNLSPSKPRYAVDEYVTATCNSGYCGSGSRYCTKKGWGPHVTCHHGCPSRNPPQYGSYVGDRKYWCSGDSATYRCQHGYEIRGHSYTICNDDYTWNYPVPTCAKICFLPEPPAHGMIHAEPPKKSKFSIDEWVIVRCYEGYQLSGDSSVYCRKNGWTDIPTCKRICTHRNPPRYGRYEGRRPTTWKSGDEARYGCNDGYRMYGSPTSRCQYDGSWSSDVPTCQNAPTQGPYRTITRHYTTTSTYQHSRSCQNKCDKVNVGGCSCDSRCSQPQYNDCCNDYQQYCGQSSRPRPHPRPNPY